MIIITIIVMINAPPAGRTHCSPAGGEWGESGRVKAGGAGAPPRHNNYNNHINCNYYNKWPVGGSERATRGRPRVIIIVINKIIIVFEIIIIIIIDLWEGQSGRRGGVGAHVGACVGWVGGWVEVRGVCVGGGGVTIAEIFDNNGGIAWHATSTRNVTGVAAVIGEVKAHGDATVALMRCA